MNKKVTPLVFECQDVRENSPLEKKALTTFFVKDMEELEILDDNLFNLRRVGLSRIGSVS